MTTDSAYLSNVGLKVKTAYACQYTVCPIEINISLEIKQPVIWIGNVRRGSVAKIRLTSNVNSIAKILYVITLNYANLQSRLLNNKFTINQLHYEIILKTKCKLIIKIDFVWFFDNLTEVIDRFRNIGDVVDVM